MHGVGILVNGEITDQVIDAKRVKDRMVVVKLVIREVHYEHYIISSYAHKRAWMRRKRRLLGGLGRVGERYTTS